MTTEQKNILIAEAVGYYLIQPPAEDGTEAFRLCGPKLSQVYSWHQTAQDAWADAPSYFTDLNACHEAEKILSEDQRGQMMDELCVIVRRDHNPEAGPMTAIIAAFFATAAQRAEAIGVVLKLWKAGE